MFCFLALSFHLVLGKLITMKRIMANKSMLTGILLFAFTTGLVACVLCFCDNEPQQTLEISTTHFINLI